jgi:uncharacterized protein DUF3365
MSRMHRPALAAALLTAVTLAAQTTGSWRQWTIRDAPEEVRPIVGRADVMIAAMQDSLLRQLSDKLAQGGPAFAVDACHMDPDELARRIGRSLGIAAGFTSDRLRNPTNTPRPWAASIVAAHAGRRAKDVDGFVVDLGDRLGVLRPMAMQRTCVSCHGPADRISPAVRRVLAERYPADQAIGFAEGDVRGWFWVEMPKPRR